MPGRSRRVVYIDALLEGVERQADNALIVVDLLLAGTTLVTSAAQGRTTMLARSSDEARRRAWGLRDPLVAAEPGCREASSLEDHAGPAHLVSMPHTDRALVLACPTAELLQRGAERAPAVYVACLRNLNATVNDVALRHDRVAVIAAGYDGQERSEDRMTAAWVAGRLMDQGYQAGGLRTSREVERWSRADLSVLGLGRGADHLRRMGHEADLSFALTRVDDLDLVCLYSDHEVRAQWSPLPLRSVAVAH